MNHNHLVICGYDASVMQLLQHFVLTDYPIKVTAFAADEASATQYEHLNHQAQYCDCFKMEVSSKIDWRTVDLMILASPVVVNEPVDLTARIKWVQTVMNQAMAASFTGLVLLVAPQDELLVYSALRFSGLPTSNVFGLGTLPLGFAAKHLLVADSAVAASDIALAPIGTQENASIPWSRVRLGGTPLLYFIAQNNKVFTTEQLTQVADKMVPTYQADASFLQTKAMLIILAALAGKSGRLLPLTHQIKFGDDVIAYSSPVMLTQSGVAELIELNLSEEEKQQQLAQKTAIYQTTTELRNQK